MLTISLVTRVLKQKRPITLKPITLIVPFAAGGGTDTGARFLSAEAEKVLGQSISVVNMPGAAAWIGYTELLAQDRDGYTVAQFNDLNVIGGYLDKNQKRDNTLEDFEPIICYVTDPTAISVKYLMKQDLLLLKNW